MQVPHEQLAALTKLVGSGTKLEESSIPGLHCYPASLTKAGDASWLAADSAGWPFLLRIAGEHVEQFPFASTDHQSIRHFVEHVDASFLPRPQGALPAIAAGNRHPEISLPAVFDAYRRIIAKRGVNLASTVQLSATREMTTDEAIAARDGENPTAAGHTRVSIRHLYHAGLWAAIRTGFRHGYNAEADHFIVTGQTEREIDHSVEAVKEAIRQAAGYTKFTTDTSRMFELRADPRHPQAWPDAEIETRFAALLTPDEQRWILAEFAVRKLDAMQIKRLAVKFARSLKLNEELFDSIVKAKQGKPFDFEPSLDEADTLTTPEELTFYMHWLKARGRPAQLVPPNLGFKKRQAYPETVEALEHYVHHKMWPEVLPRVAGQFAGKPLDELSARVRDLAAVAQEFDGTLSIHSGSGKQAAVLNVIGEATHRRFNYKISGELQLQLFDVLSAQPATSPWRQLYDRMVERCERFAAAGAFGEESALATPYRASHGSSLGDAARGRTDGNLFLVFWLGNVVGSKDSDGHFFKDKLDELPADLLAEVRSRNTAYVEWLAAQLLG